LHIIADSIGDQTEKMLSYLSAKHQFSSEIVQYGNGGKTFLHALQLALRHDKGEIVYFVEDDFLHLSDSRYIIEEAFHTTNADYVTLYDHPDKYVNADEGGPNPYIRKGGELTRVLITKSTHWKLTNSTVMTFAARVGTLREDEKTWLKCVSGKIPKDFLTFSRLTGRSVGNRIAGKNRVLIHPIPGRATHGESDFLSPFVDWKKVAESTSIMTE
jgi:hypothetical protein